MKKLYSLFLLLCSIGVVFAGPERASGIDDTFASMGARSVFTESHEVVINPASHEYSFYEVHQTQNTASYAGVVVSIACSVGRISVHNTCLSVNRRFSPAAVVTYQTTDLHTLTCVCC